MKEEKGITIISLVVTISILIILTAVTISTTVGENGFIKKFKEAKDTVWLETTATNVITGSGEVKNYTITDGVKETTDITAPIISSFTATKEDANTLAFSVVATDMESGIEKIEYSTDNGTTWRTVVDNIKSTTYKVNIDEGTVTYTAQVKVTNGVGLSDTKTVTINLTN